MKGRHLRVVPRHDGRWSVAKFHDNELVGSASVHATEQEAHTAKRQNPWPRKKEKSK